MDNQEEIVLENDNIGALKTSLDITVEPAKEIIDVGDEGPAKDNKMGTLPVKRLIVSMSIPMMISMLVQALYNIVDSFFVSQISENALTAVTMAFPLQMMLISVGSGTGVGINAVLSKALGEKNQSRANKAANNGILLAILSFGVFVIVGFRLSEPFIRSQTEKLDIIDMGSGYLSICCTLSLGLFLQMTFERLLQSTGRTHLSMISQMTGAIINIIFDPIFIFGLFGIPAMGVKGAAYATVLGQSIAALVGLVLNIRYNIDIMISFKRMIKPSWSTIGKIYAVGVPSILMMAIGSVMSYCMNQILVVFSTTAVAVFGVYFKLQSFIFMPVFGLNNGLIPVLAYNFGARNKERINEAVRFGMVLALSIMTVGTIVFWVIPEPLLKIFKPSEYMLQLGVPALRIISLSFPIAALCIAMGSMFQAFSKSKYSLVVSIGRQLVALIPAAWLLSMTGNVQNVWWAFPIAEGMSMILSTYFYKRINRNIVMKL
ncbi:putative efflux protein, MATE family [Lachnospiraceae bacterium NE2001]|nr:putative efflux protein, MATE family [Lachnospiraceae bacterium NE2001]